MELAACQQALDAYCARECTPRLGVPVTFARLSTSSQQNGVAWRCYAPATLTEDLQRHRSGAEYCTRHMQLLRVLEECRQQPEPEPDDSSCPAAQLPRALPPSHPWVLSGYTGAVLSTRPLVVELDGFMDESECEALITATDDARGSKLNAGCPECGMWWMQEHDHARRQPSALLDMLEQRIGNLTGVADHGGEAAMKVTSYVQAERAADQPQAAYSLHHEKIQRPDRIATVLVYLSTLQPHEGGHTSFPAAQRREGEETEAARRRQGAFLAITPPRGRYYRIDEVGTNSRGGGVGLKSPEAAADPNVGLARSAAEAACRDAAAGTPSALAVQPRRGTAVIWYHEKGRNRTVDPLAWHAGCFVRGEGATRWALQKFKEDPDSGTPQVFWDTMEAHYAAAAGGEDANDV